MRPLEYSKLDSFLKRFNNFIDAEFRALEVVNPTTFKITFALQDGAKEFDWITLSLEFSGVSDAKLLDENKMSFVDMSDGVTFLFEDNSFIFAPQQHSKSSIINASYYIICNNLKYMEGQF